MKAKTVLCLVALLLSAQIALGQGRNINIDTVLTVDETVWSKDSQVTATLTVTNSSSKDVKINLPPRFIIERQREDYSVTVLGDAYSSREKEKDSIVLEKTKNSATYQTRQFFEFLLESKASKAVEFKLTNLAWNDRMSSIRIDNDWFYKIPSGDYNLYYLWSYYEDKEGEKEPVIKILSNKISVKLKSEK